MKKKSIFNHLPVWLRPGKLVRKSVLLMAALAMAGSGHAQTQLGTDVTSLSTASSFGFSTELSADGRVMAVSETGGTGKVRIYEYKEILPGVWDWDQIGQTLEGIDNGEQFGSSVSISSDGSRVAIGAPLHDGTGASEVGYVRVYEYNGGTWQQMGGSGNDINGDDHLDRFGWSVSLSANGNRLAVGAPTAEENSGTDAGIVKLYEWSAGSWSQIGGSANDLEGLGSGDKFGTTVSLSDDGKRLSVSTLTPFAPGQLATTPYVQIYEFKDQTQSWQKLGDDIVGNSARPCYAQLDYDGSRVVISFLESTTNPGTGQVWEYSEGADEWYQLGGDLEEPGDIYYGRSCAISDDGRFVAVGAPYWDNSAGGPELGAVFLYEYDDDNQVWNHMGNPIYGTEDQELTGSDLSIAGQNCFRVSVPSPFFDSPGGTNNTNGRVRVFEVGFQNLVEARVIGSTDPQICEATGFEAELKASPDGATNYTWFSDGLQVGTGQTITVTEGGTYTVVADFSYGCVHNVGEVTVHEQVFSPEWPIVAGSSLDDCTEAENGYDVYVSQDICPSVFITGESSPSGSVFGNLSGSPITISNGQGFLAKYDFQGGLIYATDLGLPNAAGTSITKSGDKLYIAGYYGLDGTKFFAGRYNANDGTPEWIVSSNNEVSSSVGSNTSMKGKEAPDIDLNQLVHVDENFNYSYTQILYFSANIEALNFDLVPLEDNGLGTWVYNGAPKLAGPLAGGHTSTAGCIFSLTRDGNLNTQSNNGFIHLGNRPAIRDIDVHIPYDPNPTVFHLTGHLAVLHSSGSGGSHMVTSLTNLLAGNWSLPIMYSNGMMTGIDELNVIQVNDNKVWLGGNMMYMGRPAGHGPSIILAHNLSDGFPDPSSIWNDPYYVNSSQPGGYVRYTLKDMEIDFQNDEFHITGETNLDRNNPNLGLYHKRIFDMGGGGTPNWVTIQNVSESSASTNGCTETTMSVEAISHNRANNASFVLANYNGVMEFTTDLNNGMPTLQVRTTESGTDIGRRILVARSFRVPGTDNNTFYKEDIAETIETELNEVEVYPNPVGAGQLLNIELSTSEDSDLSLVLFDVTGRELTTIFHGRMTAGEQMIKLETTSLNSGLYLIRLTQNGEVSTHRFVVE